MDSSVSLQSSDSDDAVGDLLTPGSSSDSSSSSTVPRRRRKKKARRARLRIRGSKIKFYQNNTLCHSKLKISLDLPMVLAFYTPFLSRMSQLFVTSISTSISTCRNKIKDFILLGKTKNIFLLGKQSQRFSFACVNKN